MDPVDPARPATESVVDDSGLGASEAESGVLVYDLTGHLVWANPAAERILGVDASGLEGFLPHGELFAVREDWSEWPPDSYPVFVTATTGRPMSRVVVGFHRPDGSFVWVSMSTRAQAGDSSRPGGVRVLFSDITARRQRELDSAEREQFFQLVATHSYDVISRHSLDGTCLYIAPAVENLLGYPPEALVGKNLMNGSPTQHDLLAMEAGLRKAQNTHDDVTMLWRARHRDGHLLWLECRGRALRNPATGAPTEIIAISRDVTERVQAQEALRQSELLYRTLAESMPGSVVIVVDSEMRVQLAAGTATDTLGVRVEELVGREIAHLPMMEGLQRLDEFVRAAFEGKTRALEVNTSLGRRLWTQIAPLGGPPAIGALVMATDITDRLRIEDALREAEQRFTDGFDASPIGMALENPAGQMMRVNDAFCRMMGRSRGQLMGSSWRDITHPDDVAMTEQNYDELVAGYTTNFTVEKRYVRPDGEVLDGLLSASLVLDRVGRPVQLFCQVVDLTERRRAERGLAAAELMFRRMFEDSPIGMTLIDLEGVCQMVNPALATMVGRTMAELRERPFADLIHPDDFPTARDQYRSLLEGGLDKVVAEFRLLRPDGESVWVQANTIIFHRHGHEDPELLLQIDDVTERRRLEEQLRYLADHDPLTGLLNRRGFDLALRVHESQAKRYGARGCLLLLDLDNFKLVNDELGHSAGDQVLVAAAQSLRRRLRAGDVLARLGGDEFAVLLPEGSDDEAGAVAAAIVAALSSEVSIDGMSRQVTVSIGAASFSTSLLEAAIVMKRADDALYRAKEAGRNRWLLASEASGGQPVSALPPPRRPA